MTTLKIQNDYSFLTTKNQALIATLHDRLRFRPLGYFHNSRYKQRIWDGYTEFFKRDTGRFLTGLLPEIRAALNKFGEEFDIIDERNTVPWAVKNVDSQFLNQWLPPTWCDGSPSKPITLEDYQIDFINQATKHNRGIIFSPTSSGKAQPLDSLIATPSGFRRMGDLKVGDMVLVPSGGSAPITGIFPQGIKKILKIEFSNGDSVECCEDHLWKVNALYDQWEGKILTGKQIKDRFKCPNGANRFNISTPKQVDFDSQETPIDPYLMGLLLGDGSFRLSNSIGFSSIESSILGWITGNLRDGYVLNQKKSRTCDYAIKGHEGKTNFYTQTIRNLGLYGKYSYEKFVPQMFLLNDTQSRLALLQGLMDTDGEISKKGMIKYTSTSEQLAKDVQWLVHSLGGIASISEVRKHYTYKGKKKLGRKAYCVHFTLPEGMIPFCVDYKKSRCNLTRVRHKNRTICNVTDIGEKDCQCIMIDHPDHLYITDNFVVTHNTFVMIGILKCLPPNTPTLILQNRKALAKQNYEEIVNWGFPNVGSLWDKSPKPPNVITVANIQSLHKIAKLLPYIKCLIVDEIHDMMSADPKAAYRRLKQCCVRIGLSATPFKFGEEDQVHKYEVKGHFGPVLKTKATESGILTTKELQDRGRLSASNCTFYYIDEPQIQHDIYIDAVTHGIAENYDFHKIVTRLAKKCTGRTLILVERIAHGDALHKMIPDSVWVQGKDDDDTRQLVIKRLKHSKRDLVAIATQGIFNTGINVFLHNLINAAGGQAEHQIIQRMGRGLRTADDKECLQYYDFIFRINEYLEKHSNKRIAILKEQGHPVTIKETIDF